MSTVRFDSVIPIAREILQAEFGNPHSEIILLRDSFGALSAIVEDDAQGASLDPRECNLGLHEALGAYSPGPEQVLLRRKDLIDLEDVIDSPDRVQVGPNFSLIDRLLTNQDWLREPLQESPPLPTAVAFSIKGGVGRTTAFALWAWHLARIGKSVVMVDLDLEAPGLAGLMLGRDYLPDYGLIDWLVEDLVNQADEALLQDCLVESPLSQDNPGRLFVLPAWGKKTDDYINKLGRIYMPNFSQVTGLYEGFAERVSRLLKQLSLSRERFDAVLLDSRAGLHDIGSGAVTRLGAQVHLFARDDHQSWHAYRQLFRHLSKSRSVCSGMPEDDLRWRLKMVAAQLDSTESALRRFEEASYDLWTELYDDGVTLEEEERLREAGLVVPQVFSLDDEAPHRPLSIRFDSNIKSINLADPDKRPDWKIVATAFEEFFADATDRLFPEAVE